MLEVCWYLNISNQFSRKHETCTMFYSQYKILSLQHIINSHDFYFLLQSPPSLIISKVHYFLLCWYITASCSFLVFLSYFPWIMGSFKCKCLVYTPANDVDLSPYSTEFYLQANVKGSKMHSHIFIAFFLFSYSVGIMIFLQKFLNVLYL
jgi:hypothetical protein